jgi:hypothetical protein
MPPPQQSRQPDFPTGMMDRHVLLQYSIRIGGAVLTKLTLTVDREVISRAKQYARRRHRSVSRIIEDYLRVLSADEPTVAGGEVAPSEITDRLTGMFAAADTGASYDALLDEALDEAFR